MPNLAPTGRGVWVQEAQNIQNRPWFGAGRVRDGYGNHKLVSLVKTHLGTVFRPAPLPGWGPRGQGPSKTRQGPGKNYWTDHVPSGLPDKNFGICGHFWY